MCPLMTNCSFVSFDNNEATYLPCSSWSPGCLPLQNNSFEVYIIFMAFYVIYYWLLRVMADPL